MKNALIIVLLTLAVMLPAGRIKFMKRRISIRAHQAGVRRQTGELGARKL